MTTMSAMPNRMMMQLCLRTPMRMDMRMDMCMCCFSKGSAEVVP